MWMCVLSSCASVCVCACVQCVCGACACVVRVCGEDLRAESFACPFHLYVGSLDL